MSEVKRYEAVHLRYDDNNIRYGDGCEVDVVLSSDFDALAAENERLRVKLMTIASAEPGRHNIEWAKAMAATGNNEAYAKWRAAFDQRDKLADALEELLYARTDKAEAMADAALAEVKPCQESPAPTT